MWIIIKSGNEGSTMSRSFTLEIPMWNKFLKNEFPSEKLKWMYSSRHFSILIYNFFLEVNLYYSIFSQG